MRPQYSNVSKHIRSLTFPFFSGQMWKTHTELLLGSTNKYTILTKTATTPDCKHLTTMLDVRARWWHTGEQRRYEPHPKAYCILCSVKKERKHLWREDSPGKLDTQQTLYLRSKSTCNQLLKEGRTRSSLLSKFSLSVCLQDKRL